MTAAERAIKRMEEKLHEMSERHREAMSKEKLYTATMLSREFHALSDAVAILREEMKKEGKQ